MPVQHVVWCEEKTRNQTNKEKELTESKLKVNSCSLMRLNRVLDSEPGAAIVMSGYRLSAELRAVISRAEIEVRPMLIISDNININDINRIDDLSGAVLMPSDSESDLLTWIEIAYQTRARYAELKKKIALLERKLEERKDIDRAKGLLMKLHGLDEESAFSTLRSSAMKNSMTIGQVARNLLVSLESI